MTIELHFHLGAHRTASSSMQGCFKRIFSKKYIRENEILYFHKNIHETPLKPVLSDWETDESDIEKLNQFIKNCENSGTKKIFVSSELVLGRMLGINNSIYPNSKKFLECLKKIKNVNVKCILFVRQQDTFIESSYKFRSKQGYAKTLNEFLKFLDINHLSWSNITEQFKNYDVPLEIYPFECLKPENEARKLYKVFRESLPNTNEADYNLDQTNFSVNDFTTFFIKNSGVKVKGFNKIKYFINDIYEEVVKDDNSSMKRKKVFSDKVKQLSRLIKSEFDKKTNVKIENIEEVVDKSLGQVLKNNRRKKKSFKLSDKQRNKILKIYEKDNEKLFSEYMTNDFGVVWDKPKVRFSLSNFFKN